MPEAIAHLIPPDLIRFLLTVVFSLLVGLEQRRRFIKEEFESRFGTDRTFTLIGILGYIHGLGNFDEIKIQLAVILDKRIRRIFSLPT